MKRLQAHLLLSLLALAAPALLHAECKLSSIATLPVTMEGLRPIVSTQVNGFEARFVADSGAFYSLITPAAATEFRLPLRAAPYGMFLIGVGGKAALSVTKVKDFTLAHNQLHNVDFIVGGTDTQGNTVGVIGQNLFRIADVRVRACGRRDPAYQSRWLQ